MVYGTRVSGKSALVEIKTNALNAYISSTNPGKPGLIVTRSANRFFIGSGGSFYGVISPTDASGWAKGTPYEQGDTIPVILPKKGERFVCRTADSSIAAGDSIAIAQDGKACKADEINGSVFGMAWQAPRVINGETDLALIVEAVSLATPEEESDEPEETFVQVPYDWNEEDPDAPGYIKNKPYIPPQNSIFSVLKAPLNADGVYTGIGLKVTVSGGASELAREAVVITLDHSASDIEDTYYTVAIDRFDSNDDPSITVTIEPENPVDGVSFDTTSILRFRPMEGSKTLIDVSQNVQSINFTITKEFFFYPFRIQKRIDAPATAHLITTDGVLYPIDSLTDFVYTNGSNDIALASSENFTFVSSGVSVNVPKTSVRVLNGGVSTMEVKGSCFGMTLCAMCTALEVFDFSQVTVIKSSSLISLQYYFANCFYWTTTTKATSIQVAKLPPLPRDANNISEAKYIYCRAHKYCTTLTEVTMPEFPEGCTGITNLQCACLELYLGCTGITEVQPGCLPSIPETWTNVQRIDEMYEGVFMECTGITDVPAGVLPDLPNTLINLQNAQYYYYKALQGTKITRLRAGVIPAIPPECTALTQLSMYLQNFARSTDITEIEEGAIPAVPVLPNLSMMAYYLGNFAYGTKLESLEPGQIPGVPNLPSLSVLDYYMYECFGATKLVTVPEGALPPLPSVTAASCTLTLFCTSIFFGCALLEECWLTKFPDELATIGNFQQPYFQAFVNTSKINKIVVPEWNTLQSQPSSIQYPWNNAFVNSAMASVYGNSPTELSTWESIKAGFTFIKPD